LKSFRRKNRKSRTRRRKQFRGGAAMIRCKNCQLVYGRNRCTKGWLGGLSCKCPQCNSNKYEEFEQSFAPSGALADTTRPSGEAWNELRTGVPSI